MMNFFVILCHFKGIYALTLVSVIVCWCGCFTSALCSHEIGRFEEVQSFVNQILLENIGE